MVAEGLRLDLRDYYTPHTGQAHIHSIDAKFKVLHWGRRRGKSRFALWETIINYIGAQEVPPLDGLVPQFHAWVVAPSQPQATQAWNELKALIPKPLIKTISEDERSIALGHPRVKVGSGLRPWGLIEVKSAHIPDSLQTVGLDVCWITEAQDVSDKAFEKVLPTLRSPGRLGKAIFEGIPPTYNDHWFQRVFKMGQDGVEGYFSHRASALDNPFLTDEDKAAIDADKEILPERVWRRMYLAEFSQESGYFTNVAECIAGDLLPAPLPGASYVAGLDLGRKMDPSVLVILDARERRVVQHLAFDAGAPWVTQRESVTRLAKDWSIERLVIDATGMGGDIFTSELLEAGLPVEPYIFTASSRESLLQQLLVSFERETLHFPHIPSMLRQIRAFQFRKMPSGNFRAEAPPGENDDEVFALALGLTACAQPSTVGVQERRYWQGRYVPTQQEANSNSFPTSPGARLLRRRRLERTMQRQEGIV
jgi:hypothetical protein